MTDTKRELRPCPFCGHLPAIGRNENDLWTIWCCVEMSNPAQAEVISDWNARVPQVPEASDKWISVENKLPEAQIEIMTVLTYREDVGFSLGEYSGDFWYDVRENDVVDDVTHWMLLPEPPRACERLNRKEG